MIEYTGSYAKRVNEVTMMTNIIIYNKIKNNYIVFYITFNN